MAAIAGDTPPGGETTARPAPRKSSARKKPTAAERAAAGLPHPPPPRQEALAAGPMANGQGPDTAADRIMLPGGFSFEPIRFDDETPEDIRVTLFYGNDGTPYTVLANPSSGIALEFLHLARQAGGSDLGQALAMDWMYERMLGEDGYAALRRVRSADPSKFAKITAIVTRIANGPLEIPKDAGSA